MLFRCKLDLDLNRPGPVKDRDVTGHLPEDDDARLRYAAVAVIDYEMVLAPKSKRAFGESGLPWRRRKRRRKLPGLFLTKVVTHLDGDREHLHQGAGGLIVHQFGFD